MQVTHVVCEILQHICSIQEGRLHQLTIVGKYLIMDDVVMSRPSRALNGSVGLQVEVPIARLGDTSVDDGAIPWIPRTVHCGVRIWIKPCLIAISVSTAPFHHRHLPYE